MSATGGSLLGGTVVTFTGVGFSAISYQDSIDFFHVDNWLYEWTTPCIVSSVSPTSLTCMTLPVSAYQLGTAGPTSDINGTFLVLVNNITAPCDASIPGCAFSMSSRNTPQVQAVSTTGGSVMTLNGALLGASSAASLHVQIGSYTCGGVAVQSATQATCAIPVGAAGPSAIRVLVDGDGYANITSGANAVYTFPLAVSGPLSVTAGSLVGGAVISLAGQGFFPDPPASGTPSSGDPHNVVLFCGNPGYVRSSNETNLVVVAPAGVSAGACNVTVIVLSPDLSTNNAQVTLPGAFTYRAAPVLSKVSPTSGFTGARLIITGTGFGPANASNAVLVGGVACTVTGWSATQVNCTLGSSPAGSHAVFVYTHPAGYATLGSVVFRVLLWVSGVGGAASPGLGGGATVTLAGAGFSTIPARNNVTLCNAPCVVTASTPTSLTCTTGALTTQAAVSAFNVWSPSSALVGTASVPAAVDRDVTRNFVGCSVVIDLGPATLGIVASVAFFPSFQKSALLASASFQGSVNGVAYTTLYTIPSWAQQGWTTVPLYNGPGMATTDLGSVLAYRFLRFQFAPGTVSANCYAREIAFNGIPVAAQASGACVPSVQVTPVAPTDEAAFLLGGSLPVPAFANNSALSVAYSLAATPQVTGISPSNGSSLGGDLVTLTGVGFPATSTAAVTVVLNGIPCAVQSTSATAVTCLTGARPYGQIAPITVAVNVAGAGLALYDARYTIFRYLDRWSALTTWQFQEPPVEGDTVVVPPGQLLLVDVSPPELFLVLVQGALVFDNRDLAFDATYIFVYGGTLQAGTEDRPFMNQLNITLHGDRFTTVEIPDVGAKCLAVMTTRQAVSGYGETEFGVAAIAWPVSTGYLDIHGKPRAKVWTRLSASARKGDTLIRTVESVDFAPGETIVVTCIGDMNKAERMVVAALLDENTVQLTAPLRHDHTGKVVPAQAYGFEDVYMFPEVGLLSRNIVIQGDDDTSDEQLFGVHTGVFMGGVYRIENAELRRCGQQGALGRYCTHAHMLSNNFLSYVRHNSIHDSYQRAATIHASSYYTVEDNFAFNVAGHTIFVEDGAELYNVIAHNLVVGTKPCIMCIASDTQPASFWMQSPTNNWINNTAGGSSAFGYWFELGSSPSGPSRGNGLSPVSMPLGSFVGNTAHSNGIGLRIYPAYTPSTPQYFYNTTTYANGLGMFHKRTTSIHHAYNRYVENGDGHHWMIYDGGFSWNPNIRDSLFIGNGRGTAVWGPESEDFYADGLTIVNYGRSGALAGCLGCNSDEHYKQGGYTYRYGRMKFVNSDVRIVWPDPHKEIYQDLDGTLTNQASGGWVTYFYAYNDWPECPQDTSGTFSGGTVCPWNVTIRKASHDLVLPSRLNWQNMFAASPQGFEQLVYRPREYGGWVYPFVSGHWYSNGWLTPGEIDWRQFRLVWGAPQYLNDNVARRGPAEWLGVSYSWINQRWSNQVSYPQLGGPVRPFVVEGNYRIPPTAAFGSSNLPDGNNTWNVMLNTVNATAGYSLVASVLQCAPAGCPVPPPAVLGNASLWSDPDTWGARGVPAAGEDVVINGTMFVVLDVSPPKLSRLTIYGRLEFEDSGPRMLLCDNIVLWGELQVGSPASPFTNRAEIVLFGNRRSPAVVINNNLFLQNKMMVVLGSLTMHGVPTLPWTRLAATAVPGATTLALAAHVAGRWAIGDAISVSPTEYDHKQAENFTITAVSGAQVTLDRPVRFRHYAGPTASSGPASTTSLAAVVALLSRNVVIRANLTDPVNDLYGAHVVVSSIRSAPGAKDPYVYMGTTDLRYVEFRHCGKWGDVYAALNVQYGAFQFDSRVFPSNAPNYLEGVAFTASFNLGIDAVAAKSITINASVFHQTYGGAIYADADSSDLSLADSVFISSLQSPLNNAPRTQPWVLPESAVFLNSVPARMTGNVVGGAVDTGFTWRPTACDVASAAAVAGNEAHAVRIGHWPLGSATRGGCASVLGATAWKASHFGIFTVDSPVSVEVRGAFVADCHIGSSIAFFARSRTEVSATYADSMFVGATLAGLNCSVDATCRAETAADVTARGCGSVLGSTYRHAGVLLPIFESTKGKTCDYSAMPGSCTTPNIPQRLCSMPWEKRYGLPDASLTNTALYLTRVTFSGFNGTVCGMASNAIVANPTEVDRNAPAYATGISWWGTPYDARFDLRTNGQTDSACAGANCDAFYFVNMFDADGSLTGGRDVPLETYTAAEGGGYVSSTSVRGRTYPSTAGSTVIGPNPLLALSEGACPSRTAWNGATCVGVRFVTAFLSDVSADAGHNALGPLQVTRQTNPADNSTWRTAISRATIKDTCAVIMGSSNYPSMIIPGSRVDYFWPATEPNQWRFQWLSKSPADAAVISLFIQRPNVWELRVSDADGSSRVVPMLQAANRYDTRLPTVDNVTGTWLFNPQARRLWMTARGGSTTRYYTFARAALIQVTFLIAMPVEKFFGADLVRNLALLLSIPSWRIRLVDVRAGSTDVDLTIADERPTIVAPLDDDLGLNATIGGEDGNATEVWAPTLAAELDAQTQRLLNLTLQLQALAAGGNLSSALGFPVLSMTIMPLPYNLTATGASPPGAPTGATVPVVDASTPSSSSGGSSSLLSVGEIAGIAAAGGVLVLLLVAAVVVVRARSRDARRGLTVMENPAVAAEQGLSGVGFSAETPLKMQTNRHFSPAAGLRPGTAPGRAQFTPTSVG